MPRTVCHRKPVKRLERKRIRLYRRHTRLHVMQIEARMIVAYSTIPDLGGFDGLRIETDVALR